MNLNRFKLACVTLLLFNMHPVQASPDKPLFQRLGGETGIQALSGAFIARLHSDARLMQNPELRKLKTQVSIEEARLRLSCALCKASGGICKCAQSSLLKGLTAPSVISVREWFYLVQDANEAMELRKVGPKEKKDLLILLMRAKDNASL